MKHSFIKAIDTDYRSAKKFSICTLVSRKKQYEAMVDSYVQAGFDSESCEFLCVDNTQHNKQDAYKGLNSLLTQAVGEYIILCHQDVLLRYDNRKILEQRITEMNARDQRWGILSNAGAIDLKRLVQKVTVAEDELQIRGTMPQRVMVVDEHFMVLKKSANLSFSCDLTGFHLYAADICMVADLLGYSVHVIDFHIYHASKGNVDQEFHYCKQQMIKKYSRIKKGKFVRTTITSFYLSGNKVMHVIGNRNSVLWIAKQATKLRLFFTGKK